MRIDVTRPPLTARAREKFRKYPLKSRAIRSAAYTEPREVYGTCACSIYIYTNIQARGRVQSRETEEKKKGAEERGRVCTSARVIYGGEFKSQRARR